MNKKELEKLIKKDVEKQEVKKFDFFAKWSETKEKLKAEAAAKKQEEEAVKAKEEAEAQCCEQEVTEEKVEDAVEEVKVEEQPVTKKKKATKKETK